MSISRTEPSDGGPSWRDRLLEVPEDVPRSAWDGRAAAFLLAAVWGSGVVLSRMTDTPAVLHLR